MANHNHLDIFETIKDMLTIIEDLAKRVDRLEKIVQSEEEDLK